ncbi:MAG: FAD-dependent oxidoreductase [Clostridium sp.]|uniref:FAD-dependent oxidoreductase n=1 Tax=Clostridium sp. TaxID=1506 RepID=UPI0030289B0B
MESVWSKSRGFKKRESLNSNIKVEVVVIGAGLAGILTAYMLQKQGHKVIVIEARTVASGNIENTTAKITSQHNLIYNKLIKEFGEEKARQYADANELAIKKYREIINENEIDCDLQIKSAYLYSLDKVEELKLEFEAAKRLGISAELVEKINLPFDIKLALKFNNQGQFNPIKFLKEISKELTIYEHTRAIEIKEKENVVITEEGKIIAEKIVVTTHFPIMNVPGFYFMKMHQERSYVLALENASNVEGMYLDVNKNGNSFRNYEDLLLIGGESHRTGKNEKGGNYNKLRLLAKELYPNSKEKFHWSAQDCMTMDGIPYIGKYSSSTPNIYVATGFNKWGMTNSMVAAMILADMISGNKNKFSEIYSPSRFDMSSSIGNLMKDGTETTKKFIAQLVNIPDEDIVHIQNGHGGIVDYNGEKVGVYKDENGKRYIVSTKCPHLGCQLQWNVDELSWDCPCHGSRFNYDGSIIDSPTTKSNNNE